MSEFLAQEEGLSYLIRPGEGFSVGLFPDIARYASRITGLGRRQARAELLCLHLRLWRGGHRWRCDARPGVSISRNRPWSGAKRTAAQRLRGQTITISSTAMSSIGWRGWQNRDERFDLVILDPPGFSRTKSRTFSAAATITAISPGWRHVDRGGRAAAGMLQRGRAAVWRTFRGPRAGRRGVQRPRRRGGGRVS